LPDVFLKIEIIDNSGNKVIEQAVRAKVSRENQRVFKKLGKSIGRKADKIMD